MRNSLRIQSLCLSLLLAGWVAGCGGSGLPNTVTVDLPDGTQVQAALGEGVASLTNSRWQFEQDLSNGQSVPFVVIAFGANGELARFENNTIASEVFGDEIVFDGARHATTQDGVTYAAATYGAETSDATGFAFEGHLTAFAAGFTVATAIATAQGTFDPNDPDTMTGSFAFESHVNVPGIPNGDTSDSFNFIAHRIAD